MSQRTRILAEVWGFRGWRVRETFLERPDGSAVVAPDMCEQAVLVLRVERRWTARCSGCGAMARRVHARLPPRRWRDLACFDRPVEIEASPVRVKCRRCGNPVEMLGWAEPYQRQTTRLQQQLALQAASMPVMHVAVLHGLDWTTVRRAEALALERWDATRPPVPLRQVGIDEKYLGRRHHRAQHFVTIVSNLETGEPVWIGEGREGDTIRKWLQTLSPADKAGIQLIAMDMFPAFRRAVAEDAELSHVALVHDPFHILKRAGEAVTRIRKDAFFRAGPELRAAGRFSRWLVLRSWDNSSPDQQARLRRMFALNRSLARAYQIVEELRVVLRATSPQEMTCGLRRFLRRTQLRRHKHLRKLHDSVLDHWDAIVALARFRPNTGRIEALNNNWETLVRRARGYRDLDYLFRKLRFMTANPIRTVSGTQRFLALGLRPPLRAAA